MDIPGIVLAGGKSSRMGRPKALLPIGRAGETFLQRITRTLSAAGIEDLVVVGGADAAAIRAGAHGLAAGVRIVDNPDWERGQLTSILAGLDAVNTGEAGGILVTLVDVPLVNVSTVRTLTAVQRERQAAIVRPVSNGRHGHPVIFGRALFDELRRADPAAGDTTGRLTRRSPARQPRHRRPRQNRPPNKFRAPAFHAYQARSGRRRRNP